MNKKTILDKPSLEFYKYNDFTEPPKEKKELVELEGIINKIVYDDNQSFCNFEYSNINSNNVQLNVYTFNPRHKNIFLMVKIIDNSQKTCLEKTLLYLKKEIKTKRFLNYKVEWQNTLDLNSKLQISYFQVSGIKELMDKFYSGEDKNEHDFIIYNISMIAES